VLVVQDTTGLAYGEREGLGLVACGPDASPEGLWLHTSLAVTPAGRALGLVRADTWVRERAQFGKAARRKKRPIGGKESQRWLDSYETCAQWAAGQTGTRWVNLADREADIYELFLAAQPEVGVLVRARHNRRTMEGQELDQVIQGAAVAGTLDIKVPRKPGAASRPARLEVRFAAVQVQAPKHCPHRGGLNLWVVDGREAGGQLHWRLVTNLPVETLESAVEKIQWYQVRWQIEEYHRVLKSGCQAEGRQLETGTRLIQVLMVDLVVAWRILTMSRQARQQPQAQAGECFTAEEISLIRKSDGHPGAMTLWRGLERLSALLEGYRLAKTYG